MLKIALRLFPGKVRSLASRNLPGCVNTSVTCRTAVIKSRQKRRKEETAYSGSWFGDTGHHLGEGMVAGVGGGDWSHDICSEEAEMNAAWSLLTQSKSLNSWNDAVHI